MRFEKDPGTSADHILNSDLGSLRFPSSTQFIFHFYRYKFEKDGKICTLRIKECRPDDECEYACGVDEKRSRARLFVEGEN